MEASLRARLGGRRAISWQAVVIGDLLIVTLATVLAASEPGSRRPVDAATDMFAITMATAVIAAVYTGLAHLTVFRNRSRAPLPVPVAVGFHLSVGVIFLIGFAVGAAIIDVPQLGGTVSFSLAVLMGGLLVCIPTSLLLDHSDRYRRGREELTKQLAELEQLRISEWSLRNSLRDLSMNIDDATLASDVADRLDALELSDDVTVTTKGLWAASSTHHRHSPPSSRADAIPSKLPVGGFATVLADQIARDYPTVRWSGEFGRAFSSRPRFPVFAGVLTLIMVWLFLTVLVPTSIALPIALAAAVGNGVVSSVPISHKAGRLTRSPKVLVMAMLWSGLCASIVMTAASFGNGVDMMVLVIVLSATAAVISIIIVSWINAVVTARESQVNELASVVEHRRMESTAVFASLTTIVTRMADAPALRESAAVAACATGLARIQRGTDPIHARRIIEWTESVVSAPGVLPPLSLSGRLEEVVHPWRALATIEVECDVEHAPPEQNERIVAIVDEAVRNACRHGQAGSIEIRIADHERSSVRIEIDDDGVGLESQKAGLGFERFAAVGSGGVQVRSRAPDPGTRVVVVIPPEMAAIPPP
jgi:hypothetical protein